MIYTEKVCRLPKFKKGGKHDVMLYDLCRMLKVDECAFLWIRPDAEEIPYGGTAYGHLFEKPKKPRVYCPESIQIIYPVPYTTYRALRRSVEASIHRLGMPLKLSTQGRRPIITRLPDPS